ncbi:MAG: HAMP domain-containing protein [Anaerolineae bacterium]|nr:HAMP domain-containing protein [Anaerolineae bacterium]
MKQSLRTRLVLSFLAIIAATAGLVVLLANRITANRFTYLVSHVGQMQAQHLAPLFADYYAQVHSWDGVAALVQTGVGPMRMHGPMSGQGGRRMPMMGMVEPGDERLLVVDTDNRVVFDSGGSSDAIRLSASDLDKGAPIVVGGRQVGMLIVASGLGTLTSGQADFLRQVNLLMVAAAVTAGLAVLVVGSFQAKRIVAPLRALAAAARHIAGGDLSQRVPVTSQDELGDVAVAFNMMASELEQQHELRRRAMADIAHELRTPLSVLQIDLESIEDGLTEPTAEVIAGLQQEVALLNALVGDLRTLSLAEAGELRLDVQTVDVRELVENTGARMRGAAQDKGIVLTTDLPTQSLFVAGDVQRLTQVLLNLLSNALRYTPLEGKITVSAEQVADEVRVSVQDTGEGIPVDELPFVFERFYRTDHARGRDTGGSGLGLTIARSLIEAHGGRIWAQSQEGLGSTFTFVMPAST